MPVVNRIADYAPQMTEWRRYLHTIPELGNDCFKTAAFVAERLRDFGVDELHEGFATTGIVAIINGQAEGPTIGLRADMDALPIVEETGKPYASQVPGKMHACGHDGHTTMLLGAARYLARNREFTGTVYSWQDSQWQTNDMFEVKRTDDLPVVGVQNSYLSGHDEIHSLSANLDVPNIRFWMGFGEF